MSPGKHGPNRLASYSEIHQTQIEQVLRGGFVASEDLSFESIPGAIIVSGRIRCLGGIYIDVRKRLALITNEGANSTVQTSAYSYNVAVEGIGNIFRYDSAHADHNQEHHVHRYDVLNGDREGEVELIYDEERVPTLREVIDEAEAWYYAHYDGLSS